MYIGVEDAACMPFHEHLIGAGLRLRNVSVANYKIGLNSGAF